jgi:class 3 adenylate cyclase
MKRFFDLILGYSDEKDVYSRQYNIAVFGIIAACVFYGIMNYFTGLGIIQVLIPYIYGLFLLPLYLLSRFKGRQKPFIFSFSFMVFYYVEWIWNGGGSSGSMQVFFGVVLLAGIYFLRDSRKWIFAAIHILAMIALMIYEYKDGSKIISYPSEINRFADVMVVTISGALMTAAIVLSAHKEVEKAKKKNRDLLGVILPDRVIGELMDKGSVPPRRHQDVSVLFCDIVNFTSSSTIMAPDLLIQRLNRIYTEFDRIVEDEHCERIKTTGDAYLAVANMNILNEDGLASLCRCAIRFIAFVERLQTTEQLEWRVRIGIHEGEVVGAVVGTTKYIYDVFGDTVNFASRLESHSEPMRINTSEEVKERLGSRFAFLDRGVFAVKGRGECKMYFLASSASESNK